MIMRCDEDLLTNFVHVAWKSTVARAMSWLSLMAGETGV